MSIARALTTVRRARGGSNEESTIPFPARAGTLKKTDFRFVDRAKISLPITLISTTNALAYDAPDIPRVSADMIISPSMSSSSSSRKSYEASESGASSATSICTPGLSREGSPVLGPNHLTNYFSNSPKKSFMEPRYATPIASTFKEIEIAPTTPAVPSRALSHTKHTHQASANKRSESRLSSERPSSSNSRIGSGEPSRPTSPDIHPFGAELAQVMEVAEEFGVKNVHVWDEEEQFLIDAGFGRFSAEDYMLEIQPLFGKAFYNNPIISNTPIWL